MPFVPIDPNLEQLLHFLVLYNATPDELYPEKYNGLTTSLTSSALRCEH